MPRASRLDRAAAWLAALACLIFLAGVPASSRLWRVPAPGEVTEQDRERAGRGVLRLLARSKDEGAPIVGATGRIFWVDDGRYRLAGEVEAGPDGVLVFDGVPRGAVWVLVEADGFGRASTQLVLEKEPRAATLELGAASRLTVRVQDEGSRPIGDATVLVSTKDPLPFGALTTNAGVATFLRLGPPPYSVRVAARGYETVTRADVVSDITVTLRQLAALEVLVRDATGAPVPGANVVISGPGMWPARKAVTREGGRVLVSGLETGAFDVRASKGALISPTAVGVSVTRGERRQVALTLTAGRMVTVRVTDGTDDPPIVVPAADVVLVEQGISSFPLEGRTNTFGEVKLGPLPRGPAVVAARAEGFVPRSAVAVPDDDDEPVRVALLRAATLDGTVVDEQGRGVEGATIEVVGTTPDGLPIAETPMQIAFRESHFEFALSGPAPLIAAGELGVMPGPIPPIPGGPLGVVLAEHLANAPKPWVTGFDGTFSATPVPPGRVRALVRHPEYVEAISRPVTVGPGGKATVRVVLVEGGAIEGRVLDVSGIPVAGARVDVAAVVGTLQRTTMTATDGTFAFAAVPSRVTLAVARTEDPSRIVWREPLEVPSGERKDVEVVLPEKREEAAVRVVGDGVPVELAQVTVVSVDPRLPFRETGFSDEEGLVHFDDAVGMDAQVLVEAPGFVRYSEVRTLEEQTDVELSVGVLVEGSVTAVRGRVGLEDALVELRAAGQREITRTDAQGAYRFESVPVGAVTVVVSHPDYAEVQVPVTVERTGRADRPFVVEPIDLAEAGRVRGTVLSASGEPVSGARVAVGAVAAYLPLGALPRGMVRTDKEGTFELLGLDPGLVDLEAYSVDHGRGRASDIDVRAGEQTDGVVIRLRPTEGDEEPGTTGNVAVTLGELGDESAPTVVIVNVADPSEAARAGLEDGDVLLEVDGVEPRDMEDARELLGGPEGTDVVVVVDREGEDELLSLSIRRERVRR